MATSITDPAKIEHTRGVAPAAPTPEVTTTPQGQKLPPVGHDSSPVPANAPGVHAQDFFTNDRIHVKHGSLFVDSYLVMGRRELDPANEAIARRKLALTYSINNPSFFEAPDRNAIALNLGQLIPSSATAKRSALLEKVQEFNKEVDSRTDTSLAQQAADKRAPFAAIVRDVVENPKADPVGLELLQNSLGMYMLVREKLTKMGFKDALTNYVVREQTPDQVLADLADKIGTTPRDVREAALKGGLDGVGKLLGLEPGYVGEVKKLMSYATTQDFGYNLVEHWHLGRQLTGIATPLQEKLQAGMQARISSKLEEYRALIQHNYTVPQPIAAEQKRIADALNLVDPVQRALMYRLGYEICYSPEMTADDIAYYKGIYGLHRKAANDLSDVRGTYRIYFSGHGDLKKSYRTLVHEIAHNLWPNQFSPQDIHHIDEMANADADRFLRWQKVVGNPETFTEFERFHKAYLATPEVDKPAMLAKANAWLKQFGVSGAEGLFPYLGDAREFQFMVAEANDRLTVEGGLYNRSGYDSPQERFREVISRFAELKQVEYRDQPQLLHFLAPGLDQVWETKYLPHLNRVYHAIGPQEIEKLHFTQMPTPAPVAEVRATPDPVPVAVNEPAAPQEPLPKVNDTPAAPPVVTSDKSHGTPVMAHAMSVDLRPDTEVMANTIAYDAQGRVAAAQQALTALAQGGR